jgi:hypothetical protein
MKFSWVLACTATLLSCASASKTNLVFRVVPADGDVGCIGVTGFEVEVTSAGQNARSGPLLNAAPVLDMASCGLPRQFDIQGIDVDSPASVVVTGHDGAGATRVQATASVDNLHATAPTLQLKTTSTPVSAVLVINQNLLLGATPPSDITHVRVETLPPAKATIVDFAPGPYFAVDPGAYGALSSLAPGGMSDGTVMSAVLTTAQITLPRVKLTAKWNQLGGYYDAQP